jgi:hypothetical protein
LPSFWAERRIAAAESPRASSSSSTPRGAEVAPASARSDFSMAAQLQQPQAAGSSATSCSGDDAIESCRLSNCCEMLRHDGDNRRRRSTQQRRRRSAI